MQQQFDSCAELRLGSRCLVRRHGCLGCGWARLTGRGGIGCAGACRSTPWRGILYCVGSRRIERCVAISHGSDGTALQVEKTELIDMFTSRIDAADPALRSSFSVWVYVQPPSYIRAPKPRCADPTRACPFALFGTQPPSHACAHPLHHAHSTAQHALMRAHTWATVQRCAAAGSDGICL